MNTKRNKTKTLLIVGLLLAVSGLTLGFAAFSNTLTIKSSATVTPDSSTFSVQFSASETEILVGEENPITPTIMVDSNGVTATNAIIDANNPTTISNLNVSFTGYKSLHYDIYIHNTGEYDAYLNEVIFKNVEGENSNIVCKAIETGDETRATDVLVEEACLDMVFSVALHDANSSSLGSFSETTEISNIMLGKGQIGRVRVLIKYLPGRYSTLADGPFDVKLGDIELVWSTKDVNANS